MEIVEASKYLVVIIDPTGNQEIEIKAKLRKANNVYYTTKRRFIRNSTAIKKYLFSKQFTDRYLHKHAHHGF